MLKPLVVILALGLGGCGGEEEATELVSYLKTLQRFQPYNQQVQRYISFFEAPGRPVTQTEIEGVRALLAEYARAVETLNTSTFKGEGLREAHHFYVLTCQHAQQLSADTTGGIRQQTRTVVFALHTLRAYITGRFYPGLGVMLTHKRLEGDLQQPAWPE
ncbi:MAG: hypothetical protein HYW07_06965 [Candidatus Latescibacteria bacterium]|nr:hypothetical protein [Candidatus Latescibacterota bacterium]